MAGCTSFSADTPEGMGGRRSYIGIVTVEAPLAPTNVAILPRVRHLDVTTIGLRVDRGVSLGYLHDRLLSLPLDCRLVVFVRSAPELAHAEQMLRVATKENLCIGQLSE